MRCNSRGDFDHTPQASPTINSPRAVLPISHQPLCQSPIPTWLPCNPSRHCDCARCHPSPVPVDKLATRQAGTRRGEGVFSPQTWRWNGDAVKPATQRTACRYFLSSSIFSVFASRVLAEQQKWLATHPPPAVSPPPRPRPWWGGSPHRDGSEVVWGFRALLREFSSAQRMTTRCDVGSRTQRAPRGEGEEGRTPHCSRGTC